MDRQQAVALTECGLTLCWIIPRRHQIGVPRLFDNGQHALYQGMLVSELVTNAVRTSGGLPERPHGLPTVRLWLSADHERVLIQVWDADGRLPVPRRPDPDAEHGRGLLLVEALSEEWGTYRPAGYPGKIVWARCVADYSDAEQG